jgi:hypothetical protein
VTVLVGIPQALNYSLVFSSRRHWPSEPSRLVSAATQSPSVLRFLGFQLR